MFSRSVSKVVVAGLMLCSLAGCEGESQVSDAAADYAVRVEEALKLQSHAEAEPPRFPPRRDRRHVVDPVRISLGDWHALEACDAGGLIAAANSPMGRVRNPFEQFRHSAMVLGALSACAGTMSPEAWDKFQQPRSEKAAQLDEERWNAFWMSAGVEKSFSRETPFESAVGSQAPEHWRTLLSIAEGGDASLGDTTRWYESEQRLEQGATIGEVLYFMNRTSAGLERVARAVEQTRRGRTACLRADRRVIALMRGYYVKRLQPLMVSADATIRSASEVMTQVLESLEPSAGVPDGMGAWTEQWREGAALERYRAATREHAAQLGYLLETCGERP